MTDDILEEVKAILEYGPICDHCLGRMFGKRSFGLTNDERGRSLRIALSLYCAVIEGGHPILPRKRGVLDLQQPL